MATEDGGVDEMTGPLRLKWFTHMLRSLPTGSLVDLGSGHGVFARLAADEGWQVTALDARGDRYPIDDRIDWQIGDVRDFDAPPYDAVLCLGLFYHLTLDDQLQLLETCRGRPIILDTHVANSAPVPMIRRLTKMRKVTAANGLTFFGKLYTEPDQATNSPASWGNDHSFWPHPRALYRMLEIHGYDVLTATPWYLPSRTFFLCLPHLEAAD